MGIEDIKIIKLIEILQEKQNQIFETRCIANLNDDTEKYNQALEEYIYIDEILGILYNL